MRSRKDWRFNNFLFAKYKKNTSTSSRWLGKGKKKKLFIKLDVQLVYYSRIIHHNE